MPTPTLIDPAIAHYIKDLFHQLEVRLYTQINTYHIELRQELLKIVNKATADAIEESLQDFSTQAKPSAFFNYLAQQTAPTSTLEIYAVDGTSPFPTPTTPWDLPEPSDTFSAFPPARIVSPVEERKEEKNATQEEGKDSSLPSPFKPVVHLSNERSGFIQTSFKEKEEKEQVDLLAAIENLIDQKLTSLFPITQQPATTSPEPEQLQPQPTAEEAPAYSWGNDYDPYAYARSVNDVFNSQS
jgi:hypothetical protein